MMIMWIVIKSSTITGSIHRRRGIHRAKKKSSHHKQQQSLESLVNTVQQMKGLDKDDTVDERNGLYKFTVCHCNSTVHYVEHLS